MNKKLLQKHEKGQSLVELALMITFILILLAGVVDLGRMMYEYLSMRDAAQEGAGYGSIYPGYCNQIAARTLDNLPDNHYTVSVTVSGKSCTEAYDLDKAQPLPSYGCAGKILTVALDHDFEVTMPLLGAFVDPQGDGVPMHVIIEDRIVRPECQ